MRRRQKEPAGVPQGLLRFASSDDRKPRRYAAGGGAAAARAAAAAPIAAGALDPGVTAETTPAPDLALPSDSLSSAADDPPSLQCSARSRPLRPLSAPPGGRPPLTRLREAKGLRIPTPATSARGFAPSVDLLIPKEAFFDTSVTAATRTANAAVQCPRTDSYRQLRTQRTAAVELSDASEESVRRDQARRVESIAAIESTVAAHIRDRWKHDRLTAHCKPEPERKRGLRQTASMRRVDSALLAQDTEHTQPARQRSTSAARLGTAERVRRKLEVLRRRTDEYNELMKRVTQHRKRAREKAERCRHDGSDFVRANATVVSDLTPARARRRLQIRRQQRVRRAEKATATSRALRDAVHERAWRTAFKVEIEDVLADAARQNCMQEQALQVWLLVSVHARGLHRMVGALTAVREQRAKDDRRRRAAAVIGRAAMRWALSLRREKANRCWKTLRLHKPLMVQWGKIAARRGALRVIRTAINVYANPFGFTDRIQRFLRGVRLSQTVFRFHSRRRRLFVALVLLQLNKEEPVFWLKDEARKRKRMRLEEGQKGRKDSLKSVSRKGETREDIVLKLQDETGLKLPAQFKLAVIEELYRERVLAHRNMLALWMNERDDSVRRGSTYTRPRPNLKMVCDKETVEHLVLAAREDYISAIFKAREKMLEQGASADVVAMDMKAAKVRMWQQSERETSRILRVAAELPERMHGDLLQSG